MIILSLHGKIMADGQAALCVEDEYLLEDEVPEIAGHPIVLLNSCWAGRLAVDQTDEVNRGLAVQLASRGALQVIAPRYLVSAVSALKVTHTLLRYGWTRSAARVLRRVRYSLIPGVPDEFDIEDYWFSAYGDPLVSRMLELDGIWELEDVAEKLRTMVPSGTPLDDQAATLDVLHFSRKHLESVLAVAIKWVDTALARLERAGVGLPEPIIADIKSDLAELRDQVRKVTVEIGERYQSMIDSLGAKATNDRGSGVADADATFPE